MRPASSTRAPINAAATALLFLFSALAGPYLLGWMAEKLLPLAHHTFIAATVSTPASFPFEDAEKLLRPLLWLLLALFLGALLTALMAVGLFRRLSAWTGQPAASGRGVALGFCLWGIAAVLLISSWLRLLLPAGEELGGTAGRFSCICFGLAATAALIRALLP